MRRVSSWWMIGLLLALLAGCSGQQEPMAAEMEPLALRVCVASVVTTSADALACETVSVPQP